VAVVPGRQVAVVSRPQVAAKRIHHRHHGNRRVPANKLQTRLETA